MRRIFSGRGDKHQEPHAAGKELKGRTGKLQAGNEFFDIVNGFNHPLKNPKYKMHDANTPVYAHGLKITRESSS